MYIRRPRLWQQPGQRPDHQAVLALLFRMPWRGASRPMLLRDSAVTPRPWPGLVAFCGLSGPVWLRPLSGFLAVQLSRHGRGEGWWPTSAAFPGPFSCDRYRNYILQHCKNCVNTSVFTGGGHKNTVNTVIFATRGQKNIVNTVALGFRGENNICIYGVFFCSECVKLDDGWPESEKDVFQAALSMVVVKNSRW